MRMSADTRLTPANRVFWGQLVSAKMQKPREIRGFLVSSYFTKAVLYR
jgi:hypothetical protein